MRKKEAAGTQKGTQKRQKGKQRGRDLCAPQNLVYLTHWSQLEQEKEQR